MNKFILLLLITAIFISCGDNHNKDKVKYQNKRDNIIDVHDLLKPVPIGDKLISGSSRLSVTSDFLIIQDFNAMDELVHIFDKNNFDHKASSIARGRGPGELINMGHIGVDEERRKLYITDHTRNLIFDYPIDSLIEVPVYIPAIKMEMSAALFPARYIYINDTLSVGSIIEPIGNSGFDQTLAKWNINTGEIRNVKYVHPDVKKRRARFAVSTEHDLYVECHEYQDILTICRLSDEELVVNVHGKDRNAKTNKTMYFDGVMFCRDKIFAAYSGKDTFIADRVNLPRQLMVFDLTGDYICTLDTGYSIIDFTYDKDNNRIIMVVEEEIHFAYLDLDDINI